MIAAIFMSRQNNRSLITFNRPIWRKPDVYICLCLQIDIGVSWYVKHCVYFSAPIHITQIGNETVLMESGKYEKHPW